MENIENEFGESLDKDIVKRISEKLVNLSKEKIDGLWFELGWKEKPRDKNKALPDERIEKIKNNRDFAQKNLENLFQETPKKEFLNTFRNI